MASIPVSAWAGRRRSANGALVTDPYRECRSVRARSIPRSAPAGLRLSACAPTVVRSCRTPLPACARPPGTPPAVPGGICDIGPAAYAQLQTFFGTGQTIADLARNKYSYWLPSANLKFGIGNDVVFRLAASRDFARPSLADTRNFLTQSLDNNGGVVTTAGNPNLKPITSDNFDATLEWYFAGNRLGSITIDGFLKNIHNYIFSNPRLKDITSNGVTETVLVRGPENFNGTGKVRGFGEAGFAAAGQQFADAVEDDDRVVDRVADDRQQGSEEDAAFQVCVHGLR